MSTEEEKKEETPAFSFKEIPPAQTENSNEFSDVVEIKEEKVEPVIISNITAEEQQEEKDTSDQEDEEIYDLDDELAFKYLKENRGLEFENLDDFLKSKNQKKLDPEVEKYLEYKEKTGRGYADFVETQKEWDKESPEVLIKTVIKLNNPSLTNDEIDFLFDRDFAYDEDIDDESDVRNKKINQKIESKKALAFLENQKEEYTVPRGSDDSDIPEVYIEARDLINKLYDESIENEQNSTVLREDFVTKMTAVLNDKFDGFEFTIDGKEFKYKPEDIKKTREEILDIANLQKRFFDKGNRVSDPKGYGKAVFGGMNIDKVAQYFYNQGKTDYAEDLEKKSKNIDVKGERHLTNPSVLEGFTFKKV